MVYIGDLLRIKSIWLHELCGVEMELNGDIIKVKNGYHIHMQYFPKESLA